MRKEMRNMFRSAEAAYASFDFSGLGFITEDAFINHNMVKGRIPFSESEVRSFLVDQNIFSRHREGLDFDSFKKYFFSQLYLVQEDPDDADDKLAYQNKKELLKNKDK
jgi:hypothetical protein